MHALLLLAALVAPQGGPSGHVVINEFAYDDSGTDDVEFVELYNASADPVDISGWVLDTEDQFGSNTDYTVAANTILPPGGFWVMGSALVPNVDQVIGTTNLFENDQESITLRDTAMTVIDTLVYEANKGVWDRALAEGEGIWGNHTNIAGLETSWSRLRDGWDTDNNGRDFRNIGWTPGASNDRPMLLPRSTDFDAGAPGDPVADWGASFARFRVIDPTVVDSINQNAIPASPQGGNAGICWDESGGGDFAMLLSDAADGAVVEAYVYLDANLEATGQLETWSLGVGTSGTFANHPDPSGSLGFTANGNVGVAWIFQVTDSSATLYLVDHNDGGAGATALTPPTLLGQIAITAGVNDGWQRLRLHVGKGFAAGRFGGTLGCNDGTEIAGAIEGSPGSVYIGYREGVAVNSGARPFTCDALSISAACSNLTVVGNGTRRSRLEFALTGGAPHSPALAFLGDQAGRTSIPIGPLGTLELGLQFPFVVFPLGFTDGDGAVSHSLRVPGSLRVPMKVLAQATTVDIHFAGRDLRLDFCTSDVEGFMVGGD